MTNGNILELMDSMRKQSQWISESKTRAANKTIITLLSIWLEDTLNHSKISWRNDRHKWPKLTNMFTYQSPTSVSGDMFFQKDNNDWDSDNDNAGADDSVYDWNNHLASCEWGQFTRDPFNKLFRDN
jgi:hypothetical protein